MVTLNIESPSGAELNVERKDVLELEVGEAKILRGPQGEAGYTPQRGVDYWTDEDVERLEGYNATSAQYAAAAAASAETAVNNALSSSDAATAAQNAVTEATKQAAAAKDSAASASGSADEAATRAAAADNSASAAAASATAAAQSADAAQTAQTAAAGSAGTAQTAQTAAQSAASAAAASASSAADDRQSAESAAAAAAANASAAATSATNAKSSETAAAASASEAKTDGDSAKSSASAAAASATAAAQSAGAAQTAQTAAEAAQAAAEKARDEAGEIVGGDFATKTEAKGYADTAQSNANKYTDEKVGAITVPVQSVNGKTGNVQLGASDVGAPTVDEMNAAIAAIPTPDVSGQIAEHNTDTAAHSDIRTRIDALSTRLNTVADSDDETLDQISEVVAYTKDNRELIEQITTGKVSVSDIIDNLVTNVSNKPLSAAQGVALKSLVDTAQSTANSAANAASSAQTAATTAQNTASSAASAASAAQTAADNAASAASTAQSTANSAASAASSAASTASAAKSTAEQALANLGYTKDETLTDATAEQFGLDDTAVPNDVFERLATSVQLQEIREIVKQKEIDWVAASEWAPILLTDSKSTFIFVEFGGRWYAFTESQLNLSYFYVSEDLETWTAFKINNNSSLTLSSVVKTNDKLLVCGGTSYLYYLGIDEDPLTKSGSWTSAALPGNSSYGFYSFFDGNTLYGWRYSTSIYPYIYSSTDGITWTQKASIAGYTTEAFNVGCIASDGNGNLLAAAAGANWGGSGACYTSNDGGATWTKSGSVSGSSGRKTIYCDGYFYVFNETVNYYRSSDGVTFDTFTMDYSIGGYDITKIGDTWYTCLGSGALVKSFDLINWESVGVTLSASVYGNDSVLLSSKGAISRDVYEIFYHLSNPALEDKTDKVATALGLPCVKIETGSYTGTGTYGSSNPSSLTFGFVPKLVLVYLTTLYPSGNGGWAGGFLWAFNLSNTRIESSASNFALNFTLTNNTLSWYHTQGAYYQFNQSGTTHYYTAIG